MCGIIGIVGEEAAAPVLLDGLRRLEYRGYDSAGIATSVGGELHKRRAQGKLHNLAEVLAKNPLPGTLGIGHTRWATHGAPSENNAHPHSTAHVSVVHNGIIENFQALREMLEKKGYHFASETDTEVVPILITHYLSEGATPKDAVKKTLNDLEGAFALGIIFAADSNTLYAARRGSPLALGRGDGAMFMGSDALALAPLTNRITYLEDGDWAIVTRDSATIFDAAGNQVEREEKLSSLSGAAIGKENYRHYMLKEIYEQPRVIGETLNAYYNPVSNSVTLPEEASGKLEAALRRSGRVTIVACGTSYFAGMTAKYWLESVARVGVEIDIASEFRYRDAVLPEGGIALFISQSGETADTMAALEYAKKQGQYIISVVNVPESSMAHASDLVLRSFAGPEIGVASTKAFTTQLTVLACLTLAIAEIRGTLSPEGMAQHAHALAAVPGLATDILHQDAQLESLAHELLHATDMLYIGRGTSYATALEGALKMKEISYIHAEAYAAGELKHGPIALVDEHIPVIVIAPSGHLLEKTVSNVQEVAARGGQIVVLSDDKGAAAMRQVAENILVLPKVDAFVAPILYAIPVQLLAYHVAVLKGTDVDQPRNLAKSVTVE